MKKIRVTNKQTFEIMQVHEMKDKVLQRNENKNVIYQSFGDTEKVYEEKGCL